MLLETKTLIFLHRSLELANKFGVLGFVPKIIPQRRVELNTSSQFYFHSLFNTIMFYFSFYLGCSCIYSIIYLPNKSLSFPFCIFCFSLVLAAITNLLGDYLIKQNSGLLVYLFNSGIRLIDMIDRKQSTLLQIQPRNITYKFKHG